MRLLNIGCGKDVKKGWVNLDSHKKYDADIIHDLNDLPLPFENNEFDYIYCAHVLEDFIDPIPLLNELIRIAKKGGKIEIRVPNATCAWQRNIHHKKAFTMSSLVEFSKELNYKAHPPLKVVSAGYYLNPAQNLLGKIYKVFTENFWNLLGSKIMEHTFLRYILPVIDIRVVYTVQKSIMIKEEDNYEME